MLILAMMMTMMFVIYQQGAHAWKKSEAQTDLVHSARGVSARLEREVERSAFDSAALDAQTAVAFLSSYDDATQRYDYDPLNRCPVWHKYLICYYDAARREVRWKELPIAATTIPTPLATLAAERTGGVVLATDVTRCEFTLSDRFLQLTLELQRKRYGSQAPETIQLPCSMYFRN